MARLRRWTGQANEGYTSRLHVTDDDGRKLGFVSLETTIAYLDDESDRARLLEICDEHGVQVARTAVSTGTFDAPFSAYPYRDTRIQLLLEEAASDDGPRAYVDGVEFDPDTGVRVPPRRCGMYDAAGDTLVVAYEPWRSDLEVLLARLGVIAAGHHPKALPARAEDQHFRVVPYEPGVVDAHTHTQHQGDLERVEQANEDLALEKQESLALHTRRLRRDAQAAGHTVAPDRVLPKTAATLPRELADYFVKLQRDHNETARKSEAFRAIRTGGCRDLDGGCWGPQFVPIDEFDEDLRDLHPKVDSTMFPEGIDDLVDDCIDLYSGFFPVVAACEAVRQFPDVWPTVVRCWAEDPDAPRGWNLLATAAPVPRVDPIDCPTISDADSVDYRTPVVEYYAVALWQRTRHRRSWQAGDVRACPVCGHAYDLRALELTDVLRFGAPQVCTACLTLSCGQGDGYPSVELAAAAIRHFASVFGLPPTAQWQQRPLIVPPSLLPQAVAARSVMPTPTGVRQLGSGWVELMQRAGLVGETVATPRGTMSTASDGHQCRSLLELHVEEYLIANDIPHEVEPTYPFHVQLNSSGRRRADWLLADHVWVEAAGMLGDDDYELKLDEKRRLADELGLQLVVVSPSDVNRLHEVLPTSLVRPGSY